MTTLVASPLNRGGLADLADVLDDSGLPSADLSEPGRIFFRFDADGLSGYGGLEGNGPDRLLRSVVVLAARRGIGLGQALVAAIEHEARDLGVRRLHLLTTTAAPFFRTLGYADADRAVAPRAIATAREFTSLCPSSAAYLVKEL